MANLTCPRNTLNDAKRGSRGMSPSAAGLTESTSIEREAGSRSWASTRDGSRFGRIPPFESTPGIPPLPLPFRVVSRVSRAILLLGLILPAGAAHAQSSDPANAYLFPAGGQRGTQVSVRVEGENITSSCDFHLSPGRGVSAPAQTRDRMIGLSIAADALPGIVPWRVATNNGGTGSSSFVIGDHPEIIEREAGVRSLTPEPVKLPVTVNGRLNPQGDVDRFSFELRAGERFSAEVMAARLGAAIDTNVFVGQFGNPPSDITYKQLDATLKVFGPDGALVAQAEDTFGIDPALGFKAPKSGRYVAEVHHLAHLGMPQFVYRLTLARGTLVESAYPAGGRRGASASVALTSPAYAPAGDGDGQIGQLTQTVRFDAPAGQDSALIRIPLPDGSSAVAPFRIGDHPEALESEPNNGPEQANAVELPAALNGRFLTPGDADTYRVSLRKGELWRFDGWVERLGSPTDASLSVLDAAGKVLASNDDGVPRTHDPRLWFSAPADGQYLLQIREVGMSRLGERLVYRLEATPQLPDFEVEAAVEAVSAAAGGKAEINFTVSRHGGFNGEVTITAQGLPPGVTAEPLVVKANESKGKLTLTLASDAKPGSGPLRILATASGGAGQLVRSAAMPNATAPEAAMGAAPQTVDDLLLTIRFPSPFTIEADDSYVFMNLGTVYPAKVRITRAPGFTGPITVSMADRQPRDPQGITFHPTVVTDPMKTEIFVPMHLPQGPRGNPIVRTHVKAEAVVKDATGREWHVMQTSQKQVVLRTQAPVFSLEVEPAVLRAPAGARIPVRFKLGRTAVVGGAAEIRLTPSAGIRGVTMEPVTVPAGQSEAEGTLALAADAALDGEDHLSFEATTRRGDNSYAVFFRAEAELDLRPAAAR